MPLLSKVQVGQPITAELFNNMIDAIRECQINAVVGSGGTTATFKRSTGGTTISINSINKQASGGVAATVCPFDATLTPVTSGINVTFEIGTMNGLLPTNMFNTFNVTTSSVNYFFVTGTGNGKSITSCQIQSDTNPPAFQSFQNPDIAPTTVKVLIGVVTTAGEFRKAIPCSNISCIITPSIQEDNVTYVAGSRNFKQYYGWVLQ